MKTIFIIAIFIRKTVPFAHDRKKMAHSILPFSLF